MKVKTPHKLSSLCKVRLAKEIFDGLIDVEEENKINELLREFIVNSYLPKSIVLEVARILLVYMDRGYNRILRPKPPCEDASREDEAVDERPIGRGDINDLGRRQRASWVIKYCLHHLISRWADHSLFPEDLLKDDGLAPRAMSLRGRQTVVMHMVESFIFWTDVGVSGSAYVCSSCGVTGACWPAPPKVLNLRAEHGNWSGTRIALAAISSSIKAAEKTTSESEDNKRSCLKCGQSRDVPVLSKRERRSTKPCQHGCSSHCIEERSLIKLDVVLMGSVQDWVVDVLLYVLRYSPAFGFNIEIAKIRCEDVELERFCEVINCLAMPDKVLSLEYRTRNPKLIFSASKALRTMTGLESFVFAHLWSKSRHRTEFSTEESQELGRTLFASWRKLKKLRFEGICLFSDFSTAKKNAGDDSKSLCADIFPPSVRFLEFAYDSLSSETLNWLTDASVHCNNGALTSLKQGENFSKIDQNRFEKIHTFRFDTESILGLCERAWQQLMDLLRKKQGSLRTLAVSQCSLGKAQVVALQAVLTEACDNGQGTSFDARVRSLGSCDGRKSSLEHFTLREPMLSAKTTLNLFNSLCVATKFRTLPNFMYFGTLLPRKTDSFWNEKVKENSNQDNSLNCEFEQKLREISESHSCSHIYSEAFWEPSEYDV